MMVGMGQVEHTGIQEMPTKFGKTERKCSPGYLGIDGKIRIKLNLDK
jgi:hypothetical protein